MKEFLEILRSISSRPNMYFSKGTYDEIVAFVYGYDAARDGGLLVGFKEWLVVRSGTGNNLTWGGLVLISPGPGDKDQVIPEEGAAAIHKLRSLVEEYAAERSRRGLRHIFLDYQKWLESQGWYGPRSPDWYQEGR